MKLKNLNLKFKIYIKCNKKVINFKNIAIKFKKIIIILDLTFIKK